MSRAEPPDGRDGHPLTLQPGGQSHPCPGFRCSCPHSTSSAKPRAPQESLFLSLLPLFRQIFNVFVQDAVAGPRCF